MHKLSPRVSRILPCDDCGPSHRVPILCQPPPSKAFYLVMTEGLATIYHLKIQFQIQMMQGAAGVPQPTVEEVIAQPERRQGRKAAAQAMQVIQETIRSICGNRARDLDKQEPLDLKRSQSEGGFSRATPTRTTVTEFRGNHGGQRSVHATPPKLESRNRGLQSPIVPIIEDKENLRPDTISEAVDLSQKCFSTQELMVGDMPPPAEKVKRRLRSTLQEDVTSNRTNHAVHKVAGKISKDARLPFQGLEVLQLKKSVSAVLPDEQVTNSQEMAQKYPPVRSQRSVYKNERELVMTEAYHSLDLQEEGKRESPAYIRSRAAPETTQPKKQVTSSGPSSVTFKDLAFDSQVNNTPIQMISKQEELIMKQTDGLNYQMSDSQQPNEIPEVSAAPEKVPEKTASAPRGSLGFQAPANARKEANGEDMTHNECSGSSSNAPLDADDLDDDEEDDMMEDGEDQNMTHNTGRVNNNQTIIVGSQYQGRWTDEEHEKFLEGLRLFGKDWRRIEEFIGSRSCAQIRSHAQKYFNRLQRDLARGIKRADAAQAQMLLGKKKRKQVPQAPEEQPKTFQTTKVSTLEPPIKQQKISQDIIPLLLPTVTQDKKDIFSIVAPQGASSIKEFPQETPAPRLASQTNHQIEQIQHTLSKLSDDDIVLHLQELIHKREQISLELLSRKLQREVGGEILVQITHRFHYLAMQALQQGKFDICNRLIDERNLTQFVCILLSRQVFIGPPSRSSTNQDQTSQWGEETVGSGNPEIIQKVDISFQPTTTRTPEESSTRPLVDAGQQWNPRQAEIMTRMQHLLGGVSQPPII